MSEEGKNGPPTAGPAIPSQPSQVSIDDFKKLALRVGVVTAAQDHPNADRLLVLTVDVGEGPPRQLVAGIKGSYQASDVIGKQVVVVTNLKPATLRGVESQGMVLATSDESSIVLVSPERPIRVGSTVK
ncbi:MAG: methionine--tRNA ligase subunit beta [Candidatus Omnitrophica bacterium]|nr:methionine--tRNA ligase subunit beta [Candidatus Omnitrophota bacterium]